jgi:hypothetical protein
MSRDLNAKFGGNPAAFYCIAMAVESAHQPIR